ncbi:MAG: hypothetical protein AB1847_21595 [bacterium]
MSLEKYGVSKIEQRNIYPTNYWLDQPLPRDYNYPVENIKKDRNLRRFYVTFPASADIDSIVADYRKNPYVITADEIDINELLRQAAPPYYPSGISGGETSAYGSSGSGYFGVVEDTTPPEDVTDLSATAGDQKSTLSWTPSADTVQDLFAQLLYIDSGNGYGDPVYLDSDVKTYEMSGLTNGKKYTVKLAVIDSHHNESDGVTITVTPKAPQKAQTVPPLFQIPLWNLESQPIIQFMPTIIQIGNPGFGNYGFGNR